MKNIFTLSTLLIFTLSAALAQLAYTPETSYNVNGTYTDLGSNGSAITVSNKDDANSAAQPIGFNFSFNGTNYSYFILNTNGFIKLGTTSSMTAPSAGNLAYTYFNQNLPGGVFNSLNANDVDILSPFNHDLDSTATTEYRFHTTGTIGNRITTIQWKDVRDKNITDTSSGAQPHIQFNTMNFQVKLYEANSMIEYVYGSWNPTNDSSLFKLAGVGIKGSTTQFLTVTKSSSHEWHLAQFQTGNYISAGVGSGFNFGNNNMKIGKAIPQYVIRPLPDAGRILRFLPKINNDVDLKYVYANHALNIPWGLPHTIRCLLTNVGNNTKTGIWVYLEVSGANSYIDSTFYNSLSSGGTAKPSFTGYVPENLGTDTIHIYLNNDNENINNEIKYIQRVSHYNQGYGDSTGTFSNFGWSAGSGIFAAKYEVDGKRRISKIQAKIGFNTANVGQSVYGIVIDNTNDIVGRSANYVITANDLGEWVEFDILGGDNTTYTDPPPLISNNTFYAGLAIPGAGYFPMSLQLEPQTRTGAYYYHGGVSSGGTYTDISTVTGLDRFRICANATMDGTSLFLEPVTSINDPSCAGTNQTVEVTVTNRDSIMVDFARDTLHLEVNSTGAITQSFSRLINTGTLDPDSSATFVITNNFDLSVAGQYNIDVEARQWLEVDTANNYRSFTVTVVDTPDVFLDVSPDSIICFGTPVTFTATPYTAGSVAYQWKVNGANSGSQTPNNTFAPSLVWGDKVSVDLITDHCTTSTFTVSSEEIMMKLNPKPKSPNGIVGRDTVIENTKKNYAIANVTGNSYLWKVSGGQIIGDSTKAVVQVQWGGVNANASISVNETDNRNCEYDNVLPVSVISIVGIGENQSLGIGQAYPNPANQTVNFPVFADGSQSINLQLFDVSGKKVLDIFNGSINGNRVFVLDVSELNEGLYFYKISNSQGYQKVNRLSISR